jgi:hypothetical protein
MSGDLSKNELYEGVKSLVEASSSNIHLEQQKLFTLFSIAFQYILFYSMKNPGAYIIRVEDGILADKLAKKSKDPSTRKFMSSLLIPRKLKYEKSVLYLDYFNPSSWNLTQEIPSDKVKGSIIICNTSKRPMMEIDPEDEVDSIHLDKELYYKQLVSICPKNIIIAFESSFPDFTALSFPFIKKEKEKTISGVTIHDDIEWDD